MTKLSPSQFTTIMRLPQSTRLDLLEFLGGVSIGMQELDRIIHGLTAVNEPEAYFKLAS